MKVVLQACMPVSFAIEVVTELLQLIENPWHSPLLMKLLFEGTGDKVALEFFHKESAVVTSVRLYLLCQQTRQTHALRLAHWYMRCMRNEKSHKLGISKNGFKNTKDQMNYVLDIVLALSCGNFYVDIINQFRFLRLKEGLELLQRFKNRLKMKDVFHTSPEIYQLASQHFLTEAMAKEGSRNCKLVEGLTEHWISAQMMFSSHEKIKDNIEMQMTRATSTYYVFSFLYSLFPKLQDDDMKTFCFDLYVVMLSKELTALQEFDMIKEWKLFRKTEVRLSIAFLKLAQLLKDHTGLYRECLLTAFSINPTGECHELIKDAAVESGACDISSRDLGSTYEGFFLNEQSTSRIVNSVCINYGPDSIRDAQNSALTLESTNLRLTKRSLDDLVSILLHPRQKELHWDLEWPMLNQKCSEFRKTWKVRRYRSQRLRFLNIDFKRQVAVYDGGDEDDEPKVDDDDYLDDWDDEEECNNSDTIIAAGDESEEDGIEEIKDKNIAENVSDAQEIIDVEEENIYTGSQDNVCVKDEHQSSAEQFVLSDVSESNCPLLGSISTCHPVVGENLTEFSGGSHVKCNINNALLEKEDCFTVTREQNLFFDNGSPQQRGALKPDVGNSCDNISFENEHTPRHSPDTVKAEDHASCSNSYDYTQNNQFLNCYNFSIVQVQKSDHLNEKCKESGGGVAKTLNAVLEENVSHYKKNKPQVHCNFNFHHRKKVRNVNLDTKWNLNTNEDIKPVFVGNYVAYVDIGYDTDDDIAEMVDLSSTDQQATDREACQNVSSCTSAFSRYPQNSSFHSTSLSVSTEPQIATEHSHLCISPLSQAATEPDEIVISDRSSSSSPQSVAYIINQFTDSDSSLFMDSDDDFRGYPINSHESPAICASASLPVTDLCDSSEFPESPNSPACSEETILPHDLSLETTKSNVSHCSNMCVVPRVKCSTFTPSLLLDKHLSDPSMFLASQRRSGGINILSDSNNSPVLCSVAYSNTPSQCNVEHLQNTTNEVLDLCTRNIFSDRTQEINSRSVVTADAASSGHTVMSHSFLDRTGSELEKSLEGKAEDLSCDNRPLVAGTSLPGLDNSPAVSCPLMSNKSINGTMQSYDLRSRSVPKTNHRPKRRYGSKLKLTAVTAAGSVIAGKGIILARTRPITRSCTISAKSMHSSGLDSVIAEPIMRTSCLHQHDAHFSEDHEGKFSSVSQQDMNGQLNWRLTKQSSSRLNNGSLSGNGPGVRTRSKSKETKLNLCVSQSKNLTSVMVKETNGLTKKASEKFGSLSKLVNDNRNCATTECWKPVSLQNKMSKCLSKELVTTRRKCSKRSNLNPEDSFDCKTEISKSNGTRSKSTSNTAVARISKTNFNCVENEYIALFPETGKETLEVKSLKAKRSRNAFHETLPDRKTLDKSKKIADTQCASTVNCRNVFPTVITRSMMAKSVELKNIPKHITGRSSSSVRSGRVCAAVKNIGNRRDLDVGAIASNCDHLAETISGLSSLDMMTPPPSESTVNVVQVSGSSDQDRPLSPEINNQNMQHNDESPNISTGTHASFISTCTNSLTSGTTGQQAVPLPEDFLHIPTARLQPFQEIDSHLKIKSNIQAEIKYLTSSNEVNKILQSTLPNTAQSSSNIVVSSRGHVLVSEDTFHYPVHEKHILRSGGDTNLKLQNNIVKTAKACELPISSELQGFVRVKVNAQNAIQHLPLASESNSSKISTVALTHSHEIESLLSEPNTAQPHQVNATSQSSENNSCASLEGVNAIGTLISSGDGNECLSISGGYKIYEKFPNPQKCVCVGDFTGTVPSHAQLQSRQPIKLKSSSLLPEQNCIVYNLSEKALDKTSEDERSICLSQATLPKFQQAFGKTVYHTSSPITGVNNVSNLTSPVVKETVIQSNCTKSEEVISVQTSASGGVLSTVLSKAVQTTCVRDLSEMHTSGSSAEVLIGTEKGECTVGSGQDTVSRKSLQLSSKGTNFLTFHSPNSDCRLIFTEGHTQQNTNSVDSNIGIVQKNVIKTRPDLLHSSDREILSEVNATPCSVAMKSVVIPKVTSCKKQTNCNRFTSFQTNNLQTSAVALNSSTSIPLNTKTPNCQEHEVLIIDSSSDDEICYLGARTVPSTAIQSVTLASDPKVNVTPVSAQPRPLVHITSCHPSKDSSCGLKSCTTAHTSKTSCVPSRHLTSPGVPIPHINSGPDNLMTPTPIDPSTEKLIREFEVVMEEVTNTSQRKERSTALPQIQTRSHIGSNPQSLHNKSLATSNIEVTSVATSVPPFTHDVFTVTSSTSFSSAPAPVVTVTYGSSVQRSDVNVTYVVPSRSSSGVTLTYASSPPGAAVTYVATNPLVIARYVSPSPTSPAGAVTYVNSTASVHTGVASGISNKIPTTPVVVTTYCTSVTSPALSVTSQNSSSPCVTPAPIASCGKSPKPSKSSKSKSIKSSVCASSKATSVPKLLQKPQEDEQTAQRIYAILDEYAEQLRNSPDLNNKPAPRRRSNPPTNPNHSSKRKKSQSKTKLLGQQSSSTVPEMSPGTDDPRTIGSEDSSSGITQLSHIQDSPAPSALSTDESVNLRDASSVDNSVETENFTIDEQDGHHKLNRVIIADASSAIQGRAVIVQDGINSSPDIAAEVTSTVVCGTSVVVGSTVPLYVSSGVRQVFLPVTPGLAASVHSRSVMVSKGSKVFRVQAMPSAAIQMTPSNGSVQGTALVVRQMPIGTPISVLSHPAVKQVRLPVGSISSQTLTGVTAQPPVVLPPGSHHLVPPVNSFSSSTYQNNKQISAKCVSKDLSASLITAVSTPDNNHLNTHATTVNTVQSVAIPTTYHDQLAASVATLMSSCSVETSEKMSKVEDVTNVSDGIVIKPATSRNSVDVESTSTRSSPLLSNKHVECTKYVQDDQNFHCIGVNFVTPTKVTINELQSTLKGEYVVIGEDKEYLNHLRKVSSESGSCSDSFIMGPQTEVLSSDVTCADVDAEFSPNTPATGGNAASAPSVLCRSAEIETQGGGEEVETCGDTSQESTGSKHSKTLNIDPQQTDLYSQIGGRLSKLQKDRTDFDRNILILKTVSEVERSKCGSSLASHKKSEQFNHIMANSSINNTKKFVMSEIDGKKMLSSRGNFSDVQNQQKKILLQESGSSVSVDYNSSSIPSQMDIAAYSVRRKKQAAARAASWSYVPSGVSVAKKAKLSVLHNEEEDTGIIIEHTGVCVRLSETPLDVDDLTQEHHSYLSDAKLESVARRHGIDASLLSSYRKNDVPLKPEKLNDKVELVMQHRIAKVEKELRFQKSLSEECEDLGVDEPSTSDLFPEADLLLDTNSLEHTLQEVECSPESSEPYITTELQALGYSSSSQDDSQSSLGHRIEEVSDRSKVVRQNTNNVCGTRLLDWKQCCVNKEHKNSCSVKHPKFKIKSKLRDQSRVFGDPATLSRKENGNMLCHKANRVVVQTSANNFSTQNFTNCKSNELWDRKNLSGTGINGNIKLHVSHNFDSYTIATNNIDSLKPDDPVSCRKKSPESLPENSNLNAHSKCSLLIGPYQNSSSSSTSSEDSVTVLNNHTRNISYPANVTSSSRAQLPSPVQPLSPVKTCAVQSPSTVLVASVTHVVQPSPPIRSPSPALISSVRHLVHPSSPVEPASPVQSPSPVLVSAVRRVRLFDSAQSADTVPSLTAVQKFTYTYGKKFAHQDVIKRTRLNRPNQYFNDHSDPQEMWETSTSQKCHAREEGSGYHNKWEDFSAFKVGVNSDNVASVNPISPCRSSVYDKSSRIPDLQEEPQMNSRIPTSSHNEKHICTKFQTSTKKNSVEHNLANIDNELCDTKKVLEDGCSRCVESVISSDSVKPRSVYSNNSQTNMLTRHQHAKKQDTYTNVNNDTIARFLFTDTNFPSVIVSENINCDPAQVEVSQLSSSTGCSKESCKSQRNSRLERRSSLRGHVKRGCSCCIGSPVLPSKKKREPVKCEKPLKKSQAVKHIPKGNISKKR